MNRWTRRVRDRFRILIALVWKDLLDGLKNRSLLQMVLSVSFLMVFFRVLPVVGSRGDAPQLALYDAGQSTLAEQLRESSDVELVEPSSQDELETYLGSRGAVVLGLGLPPDFDRTVQENESLQLQGYLDHWVRDRAAAEIETTAEVLLTGLVGKPVDIEVVRDVYTRPEGWQAFENSLAVLIMLYAFGVFVTPLLVLEEKETKTIQALLVSPATPGEVVLGKALTGLFFCLVASAVWVVFSLGWIVHWGPLVAAVVLGSLFTVALGLVLGFLCRQGQQASMWGFVLLQPLVLGPAFSEFDFVPEQIRQVLSWIPTTALAGVLRSTFGGSGTLREYAPELAYLAACTALMLTAAAWLARRSDR